MSSFTIARPSFSAKFDWGSYIDSFAKTAFKKVRTLIISMKVLSPEAALYLCKSTMQSSLAYFCHF